MSLWFRMMLLCNGSCLKMGKNLPCTSVYCCHGDNPPRGCYKPVCVLCVGALQTHKQKPESNPSNNSVLLTRGSSLGPPPLTLAWSSNRSGVMPPDKVPRQSQLPLGHCDIWWEEQCRSCLPDLSQRLLQHCVRGAVELPLAAFLPNLNFRLNSRFDWKV